MSARRFRPRRRWSQDLLPLLAVASLAFAVYSLFPREAFRPQFAREASAPTAGCAFVTLSAEEATAAWTAARTSWQSRSRVSRRVVEMLPRALPETAVAEIVALGERTRHPSASRAMPSLSLLPPTAAAPAPASLGPAPAAAPRAAFSRETMLTLR